MVSGFSAVGSAHVWGARGRWFESSNPDNKKISGRFTTTYLFVLSHVNIIKHDELCFVLPPYQDIQQGKDHHDNDAILDVIAILDDFPRQMFLIDE